MNVTKQLYQWDTGQKLTECTGIYVDYLIGDEVYRVEITDGTCIIPDELLQTSGRHKVYECMTNNTIRSFAFSVIPRPKPPEYVFTPTEQLTFEGLVQKETNKFNTNAIEKLNAYNANADNRVAEFNAQTEQIQADVGELKSDLSNLEEISTIPVEVTNDITASIEWTLGAVQPNGNIDSSLTTLHYSQKIPVKKNDILKVNYSSFRFVTAYRGDTVIESAGDSSGAIWEYIVPNGIDSVVITCYVSAQTNQKFTHQTSERVLKPIDKYSPMGYMTINGDLSDGLSLELPRHNVKNHNVIVFSANITSFDSLKIGKQTDNFVTIDNTNVSVTCDSSSQNFSVAHGLTIQNNIQVIIENETSVKPSRIRVLSCGNEFEATIPNNARFLMDEGSHYVTSINSTLTDCAFSWTSRHINKPIWLFGDSYFSWYTERWTYYLARDGFTDSCMLNGHAGQNSSSALLALTNLLKVRVPQMVVWCLGMNDEDGDTEVNSSWLNCYNKLVNFSNEYGFELVLYTTPTTPTMNNRFKNAIVRNSGYRYVEADKSLRIDDGGNWIEGTLDDNVHPTIKGAKLLYHRFLADIPELTSKC